MPETYIVDNGENTDIAKYERRLRFYRILVVFVVIAVLGVAGFAYGSINSNCKKVLREAKDARIAMRMLAIEEYGLEKPLYNPDSPTGLYDGAAERISALSRTDGKIVLTAWSKEDSDVLAFTYTKGKYTVVYSRDPKLAGDGEGTLDGSEWQVYYYVKVLQFQ